MEKIGILSYPLAFDPLHFEDMFIRFDVIHERDRQTDRQTPDDSKDRVCASHRAVTIGYLAR